MSCCRSMTPDLLQESRISLLPGELVAFSGQTLTGVIVLTSYRLIILSSGPPPTITPKASVDSSLPNDSVNGKNENISPSNEGAENISLQDNVNNGIHQTVTNTNIEEDHQNVETCFEENGIELKERQVSIGQNGSHEDSSNENADVDDQCKQTNQVISPRTLEPVNGGVSQSDELNGHINCENEVAATTTDTPEDDCEEEEEETATSFAEQGSSVMGSLPDLESLLSERADRIVLPLGCLDTVEHRDNYCLHLLTKHVKCFVCSFTSIDQSSLWYKRLTDAVSYNSKLEHAFCFKLWKQTVSCKAAISTSTNNHSNGSATHLANGDNGSIMNGCVGNGNACPLPRSNHGVQDHNKLISSIVESCQVLAINSSSNSSTSTETTKILAQSSSFDRVKFDFERLSFDPSCWRISNINDDFKAFPTYPQYVIVPTRVSDDELSQVASFRSFRRIPAIVWRSRETGCVIVRSSQPEVGWFGWRSPYDEKMLSEISSSSMSSKLLILDARSYAAAVANRAKGGGCECQEYYPDAEVQFMGLANIHSIRKSFQSIRYLCQFPTTDPSSWSHSIDSSKWLHHISGIIRSSLLVSCAVSIEKKSVLVHCSDGWDRTPQIIALAELLLDPYYRSIEGFQLLIQREWIEFGHKFSDRSVILDDPNERCPVFLQWVDCVHQVVKQFPSSFEFNTQFLVELVIHVHSGLFGTFICNNMSERTMYHVSERSFSLWSFLSSSESLERFTNPSYTSVEQSLVPSCKISDMVFWNEMYLRNSSSILDE